MKPTQTILATALLATGSAMALHAQAPEGYYDSLYGLNGPALKDAVQTLIADHKVITYGDNTWEAFETTDVRATAEGLIWYDMYSNVMEFVATGHNGLNIEHSVPNSWWGGKSGSVSAYSDLHLLNPSNADANNRKSNWPLGEVGSASWTNGLSQLGTPVAGQGGGASKVFEPADEYKGDFARAYFYVFTIYAGLDWKADSDYMYDTASPLTLKPWAYELLLKWCAEDPVDDREARRNDLVAGIQGNRNPYIDMPGLAGYIWGDDSQTPFAAAAASRVIVNRPAAPVFADMEMPALNTYSGRWWDAAQVVIEAAEGDTWYSLDGGDWTLAEGPLAIPAATADGETHLIEAYTVADAEGYTLSSPVSSLSLLAKNPEESDLKDSTWRLVTMQDEISADKTYLLVSAKNNAVMNTSIISTSSSGALGSDWKCTPSDYTITGLHENTAVINLEEAASNDMWYIGVSDIALSTLGYMYSATAKKLSLAPQGTEVSVTVNEDATVTVDFGNAGRLFYNASSPRFSTYTSNGMEAVCLYSLVPQGPSVIVGVVIEGITVSDGHLNAPEGTVVYDLTGRRVTATDGLKGIYIVVTPSGTAKMKF